jgi:hypothetical protein
MPAEGLLKFPELSFEIFDPSGRDQYLEDHRLGYADKPLTLQIELQLGQPDLVFGSELVAGPDLTLGRHLLGDTPKRRSDQLAGFGVLAYNRTKTNRTVQEKPG